MPSYKILFFGKKDDNIDKILDKTYNQQLK